MTGEKTGRANSLVFDRDDDGGDVLRGVTDQWEQDEGDELSRDVSLSGHSARKKEGARIESRSAHVPFSPDARTPNISHTDPSIEPMRNSAVTPVNTVTVMRSSPAWMAVRSGTSRTSSSSSSGISLPCSSNSIDRREEVEEDDEDDPPSEGTQEGRGKTCEPGGEGPLSAAAASSRRR